MTRRLVQVAGALLVLTLASAGCSGGKSPAKSASSAGAPRELRTIGDLRAAFNSHAGEPRLIVLVSPT